MPFVPPRGPPIRKRVSRLTAGHMNGDEGSGRHSRHPPRPGGAGVGFPCALREDRVPIARSIRWPASLATHDPWVTRPRGFRLVAHTCTHAHPLLSPTPSPSIGSGLPSGARFADHAPGLASVCSVNWPISSGWPRFARCGGSLQLSSGLQMRFSSYEASPGINSYHRLLFSSPNTMKDRKKAPPFHECELKLLMRLYCDSYEEYHGRGRERECLSATAARFSAPVASLQPENAVRRTRSICYSTSPEKSRTSASISARRNRSRNDFELTAKGFASTK